MTDTLRDALDKLDASIEATMTPEQALARRRQIDARERKERDAVRTLTRECAEAIEELAHAIVSPRVAVADIEYAVEHCQKALIAARSWTSESCRDA